MTEFTETSARRAKILKEWRNWVQKISEAVREMLPDAQVFVIGSVVRGDYVGGSDVDVLIVSQETPRRAVERGRIKALIEEKLELLFYHSFEIHLLTPEEAEIYLKRAGRSVENIA